MSETNEGLTAVRFFLAMGGAIWGAALGSYLAAAFYRIPRRIDLGGRSACPSCGMKIPASLNIPVISWVMLGGRSRCCGSWISLIYPLFEFSAMVIGAFLVLEFDPIALLAGSMVLVLLIAAVAEIRSRGR